MIALRKHVPSIVAGQDQVILSGHPGCRFAENIIANFRDAPVLSDNTVIDDGDNESNGAVRDVFDVRDDAAAARRAWVLQELAKERQLKAPDMAEHFSCSVKTAQRDLTALKDERKIEFVGAPRNGYYRLCRPSN